MQRLVRNMQWQTRLNTPLSRPVYFARLVLMNSTLREIFLVLCLPLILVATALFSATDDEWFAALVARGQMAFVSSRGFMLSDATITGASPRLTHQIREQLAAFGAADGVLGSVAQIRQELLTIAAVDDIVIQVRGDRHLLIDVREKTPTFIWYTDGRYYLIDDAGNRLMSISERYSHPDLFLIAGAGANGHVDEALAIYSHSQQLTQMIRGLVRVGERRWDIMLDRGRIIMLPEQDPLGALTLLEAFDDVNGLVNLYLAVIDLRNSGQIVVRKHGDQ